MPPRQTEHRARFEPGVSVYSAALSSSVRFVDRTEGSFAGFFAVRYDADAGGVFGGLPTVEVWVPHWFLVGMTAPLPAMWLRRWVRWRTRHRRGLCPACGYDLRASPEHCPECGAAVQSQPRT